MGPATICGTNRHHVSLGWVRHDEALTKMAAACWARDRFTDVIIFCEDRILHAHRLVLASMSPLLANLLAEAEGPDTALLLPEVKAEDMRLLLQFIYQGEVVLPPRRTAALLDLAAQLCVAGVRGGNGPTPPSPPRSDSPELDSSDRNESDHISEDEHPDESRKNIPNRVDGTNVFPGNDSVVEENVVRAENGKDDSTDESNDRPMNLAAKPEAKGNENINCTRPKPCNSSPPDFNAFSNHTVTTRSPRLSEPRSSTMSYYQHPALRGCHPFSLELAINHNRNLSSRMADANQYNRENNAGKSSSDSSTNSDVEMTMDTTDDRDREIDLSLKPDSNHTRSRSSLDEEKISPSPEHDNSFESSESTEPHQDRDGYLHQPNSGSSGVTDLRMNLADKMLLLPTIGSGTGINADPRRTYLEAVLQESLVQQSYTIVLPSHLGVTNALASSERTGATTHPTVHSSASLENKAWNLAGKHSAAAAVAELQCLQGFFNSHGGLSMSSNNEPNFSRNSVSLRCDEDEEDDEDEDEDMMPTNLSTSKNGNYSSSNSMSSKRNGKEGYSCQVCRKMFTSSSNLAVHSMIHSGTKPFKCDLCSWSFRQKAHLQKHMRHIHKIIVAK